MAKYVKNTSHIVIRAIIVKEEFDLQSNVTEVVYTVKNQKDKVAAFLTPSLSILAKPGLFSAFPHHKSMTVDAYDFGFVHLFVTSKAGRAKQKLQSMSDKPVDFQ